MSAAVVTGAARGLGFEIARGLARRGLAVNVTDVDAEAAEAAARRIGARAWASALDVRDAAACRAAAADAAERAGPLAVWVNNAGLLVTGHVWEHDDALRRTLFEVNAMGTINGTLAALELMRPLDRGHVINVVSLAGLGAPPGEALYAATKHGAMAFTLGALADLRRSGSRGVRLSAVCPDGVWTPMLHDRLDDPDAAPSFSGVLLRPEDVADRVVALLDRPRVVLTIPRWRGAFVRLFDALPGLSARIMPVWMRDARRRQRHWKRRIESGDGP
ncbi:MAG: SDR family NAD(P)-dependent oxidoreductase [Solirubrobacterales bacterium]|nr:SDR family NAD(P)-dependent oxidoreductase [Solirubrobacterales bacterium]